MSTVVACSGGDGNQTPDTQIDSQPAALTNIARATFSFTALGNSTGFLCSIDTPDPSPCIPPLIVDLADGAHTFSVAAQFNANVDETPATYSWTVDTVGPDTTIIAGPPAVDNDPSPDFTFSGTDPGPVTFECSLDTAPAAPCTSPLTLNVVDGNHSFTVAAVDAAGNRDATPAVLDWSVSTLTPDTTITSGPTAGSTTNANVAFGFSSPDSAATFECAMDAAGFTACATGIAFNGLTDGGHTFQVRAKAIAGVDPSPAMRAWTVDAVAPTVTITGTPANPSNDSTPQFAFSSIDTTATFECQVDGVQAFTACTSPFDSPAIVDGTHTFRVRATDPVGNLGAESTFSWLVDTVAPTVVINTQPAALSNDATPTVTFTTGGSPTTTQCQVDTGALVNCAATFTPTVADGAHTITVVVTDAATNTANATTNSFTVDTVAPTVVINSEPLALSNDATPTVTFTTGGSPTSTQCRVDAGAFVNCAGTFTPTVADGAHTITVRVTDGANNTSSATTSSFTVDTVAPTVVINTQPAALSNDNTPTVTFTTGGSPTSTQCQIDAGAFANCSSPFSPTVADGAHTITIRVTDAATNSASATTNSFTVDTLPPTVVINTEPAPLSNDNTPTVTFTVGGSPTSTQCQVDTGAFVNCSSPFTATVADGTHTITIKVTDAATNTFSISTSSFVVDTSPPTVVINSQPAALSNDNTPTVTFTTGGSPTSTQCQLDAGAFANCSSPFTITVLDGAHTITIRVTDAATNTASATTNSFTVDTTAPTVVINTQPAALSNDLTPTVTFTTGGSPTTTQCQVDTGSLVNCAGTFTPTVTEGTHTITIVVTDGATNSASATTNPFTVDVTPPTVTINSQPLAISNDNTPTVTFTTGGAPTSTQCRVDAGGLSNCVGGTFTPTVADGTHTLTIIVTDGANNSASATTASFIVDTTAPVVTFDDTPPAQWPVNYFDMRFHATDANVVVAIECSLNGQAFFGCTTGQTITTSYNVGSTFAVRARDNAGNTSAPIQTSWTSTDGLVLHYPWEQGATNNTSLLAQNPAYSPNGTIAAAPAIGGWAGTAIGSVVPGHNYKNTDRILSSSANQGNYAASFWIRPSTSSSGTVFSTLGATNGIRVTQSDTLFRVEVQDGGQTFTATASLDPNRWVHIGLRATGPSKGLEIWVDGAFRSVVPAPLRTGFDAGQARDMTVGPWSGFDVDDLRFFNRTPADPEMCTLLARGSIRNSVCTPLSPGIEVDFEHNVVVDTGIWRLNLVQPQSQTFNKGKTGDFMTMSSPFTWGISGGLQSQLAAAHGHSFSFWFTSNTQFGRLLDFTQQCFVGGPPDKCGISVTYVDNQNVAVFVGTFGAQQTKTVSVLPNKSNSIVVTERRTVDTTISVSVYVNGALATVIPVPSGDVFKQTSDGVLFVEKPGTPVDEYEFWTEDLEANPEVLCENGFDGEFDPLTGSCSLTSN